MNRIPALLLSGVLSGLMLAAVVHPTFAHDWGKKYSTGRFGENFESCCGNNDCHTAEALGFPEIRRRDDGGYRVKLGRHWIEYDFPAVHASEDSKTWICFVGRATENPDPLCLFLPPGII